MNVLVTLIIGGVVHAVLGAGVFFAADEPHKVQIFLATTIKGLLVALLVGFSLNASPGIWVGAMYGLGYGLAFGLVVFLAKGTSFKATPYVISGSIIQGVITGMLIAAIAFR